MNINVVHSIALIPDHHVGNQIAAVIALIVTVVGVIFLERRRKKTLLPETQPGPSQQNAPEESPERAGELSPTLFAVLTAAAYEACGSEIRLVSVDSAEQLSSSALLQQWSMEGRRQIYSSHHLR